MRQPPHILIADDESISRENLGYALTKEGYTTCCAHNGTQALKLLGETHFDLVITDMRMEGHDGLAVLERAKAIDPLTEVIIITGYASISTAVEAMRKGAYSYVSKPLRLDELRMVISQALERQQLKQEIVELREKSHLADTHQIIGDSPIMQRLKTSLRQIAGTDCSVVILGETGTGKELVARTLHHQSNRSTKRFLALNCGALDENILSNELFGHEKEAFTGAGAMKKGLLEAADGGTFFLDEITAMPPSMQVKLLRVLQERRIMRVGGTDNIPIDVRIVAAANQDLREEVEAGRFRQDLYFRLNVITVHLPPLRERIQDIPILCHRFLRRFSSGREQSVTGITQDALQILTGHAFPGNVRELENIMERAVALCPGPDITPRDLPGDLLAYTFPGTSLTDREWPTLAQQEKQYILWVLEQTSGNKVRAAEILGIDRVSLWRKLRRYETDGM